MKGPVMAAVALCSMIAANAQAAESVVNLHVDTLRTSNVYFDASREWDLILHPTAELGLDFGEYWSVGYGGELNYFRRHPELLSHWHEAFLFANPAWGESAQHEYTFEVRAEWLSNDAAFGAIDLLQPSVLNKLVLAPTRWLRWRSAVEVSYRNFYNDHASRSVDVTADSALTLSLPTRTSVTPRLAYGIRRYVSPISLSPDAEPDALDHRLELGLHVGQALWRRAGLQLEGSWLPKVGNNALLQKKLSEDRFLYLGQDFLYTGHRERAVFRQIVGESWMFEASLAYEAREYAGWPGMDVDGVLDYATARRDWRLVPRLLVKYTWAPAGAADSTWMDKAGVTLDYAYTDQRSNNAWYQTEAHVAAVTVWSDW